MGIKGFWKCADVEAAQRKVAAGELAGKRVAVDTALLMHRWRFGFRAADGGPKPNAVLRGLFFFCLSACEGKVGLVFCLEGAAGQDKRGVIKQRIKRVIKQRERAEEKRQTLVRLEDHEEAESAAKRPRAEQQPDKDKEGEEQRSVRQDVLPNTGELQAMLQGGGMTIESLLASGVPLELLAEQLAADQEMAEMQEVPIMPRQAPAYRAPLIPIFHPSLFNRAQSAPARGGALAAEARVAYRGAMRSSGLDDGAGLSWDEQIGLIAPIASLFGFPSLFGAGEGEATAALLARLDCVYAVATEDGDAAALGAQRVIRKLFSRDCRLLEAGKLDRMAHIRLAYFVGCDFTEGVKGVGAVKACEVFKAFPPRATDAESGDAAEECVAPLRRFAEWFRDPENRSHASLRTKLKAVRLDDEFPKVSVAAHFLTTSDNDAAGVEELRLDPKPPAIRELLGVLKIFFPEEKAWAGRLLALDPVCARLGEAGLVQRAMGSAEEAVTRATAVMEHAVAEWDEEQIATLFLPQKKDEPRGKDK
jgi:5'-3' exonuclease